MAGLVPSSYFAGFTLAALRCGPIRAGWAHHAAFAGMVVTATATRRGEPPRLTAAATLPYGELVRAAPVAVVDGALSGLISSSSRSFRSWMQDEGIARETIAMSMLVAMLGGSRCRFQSPALGPL